MQAAQDQKFMQQALQLAQQGMGFVNPNPMVGAVIVKNQKIIAQGFHAKFGDVHAEAMALACATESVQGATLYVTLEPCSHYGKTPPCAQAIVNFGIAHVVIASLDPNPLVSGKGVQILKDANIKVTVGVCQKEAVALNRVFFKYIQKQLPYVLLKSAITLDGKIATASGDSKWITSEKSRQRVHALRHQFMAVMVGINTVLKDDPQLNCRLAKETRQPIKIIVDSLLQIPFHAKLWASASLEKIIVATTEQSDKDKRKQLQQKGAQVIVTAGSQVDLQQLMQQLAKQGIDSVLLEGGGTLNASALKENIVDEVWTFIAPKIIGGLLSPSMVTGEGVDKLTDAYLLKDLQIESIEQDFLIKGMIRKCLPES